MSFARIALPVPLHRYFDYILPASLNAVVGARVWVPFGAQKRVGMVVEVAEQSDVPAEQLKTVLACIDEVSLFSPQSWQFLQWAAGYYHAPLGEVLSQALPVKLRQGESAVENPSVFWKPTALGEQALAQGLLKRAKKQLEALQAANDLPEKGNNPFSAAIWSALKAKDYVTEVALETEIQTWQQQLGNKPLVNKADRLTLNKSQALVFSQLKFTQGFVPWLLDGVTGSGKTEI